MRRALVLVAALGGCLPPPEPPGADVEKTRGSILVSAVALEGGVLSSACTKTGVERCFDAADNDCNGLVDEGCGLPDGEVALLAAWDENPAVIDWVLYLPGGKKVDKLTKKGSWRYAKDCPESCFGQNLEAIVGDAPAKGAYRAELRLRSGVGAELPVRVHLALRFGTRVEEGDVTLDLDHELRAITFTL